MKSKKTSGKKRRVNGVDSADIAAARQSAIRPKRRGAVNRTSAQSADPEKVDAVDSDSDNIDDVKQKNMLRGDITIWGGKFIQAEHVVHVVDKGRFDPYKHLRKLVAHSAFHNSAVRFDPPRCHLDTRVAILQSICDWMLQSQQRDEWLLWLNGAAGAGKSAIMQSIAERCAQTAVAIASFFFFRSDPTRNTTTSLVATLAYQLIQAIPETRSEILSVIEHDPLIFDRSLESQLQLLLIQPLLSLPDELRQLFVVLIDGLDECNDRAHQSSLIKSLGSISRDRNSPVLFLVASRREPQIEGAFADKQVSKLLRTLALDNSDIEQTSEDIRRFLADRFTDIKEIHLRKHLLASDWPQRSAVEEIVSTSSGQFIYASVVINYVSSPRGNPAHLLDIVRGIRLRDSSSQNPFAHLDALYQHIFSQVEAIDKVLDILAYILITSEPHVSRIEGAFLLENGELEVFLADLTAIIECERRDKPVPQIKFLHASLPDFLRDKTRSERYHIDFEEYVPKLLCMFLDRAPPTLDPLSQIPELDNVAWQEHHRFAVIKDLLACGVKVSDSVRRSFMTFRINSSQVHFNKSLVLVSNVVQILKCLVKLNFNDMFRAYHHVLHTFAEGFAMYWSSLSEYHKREVEKSYDLHACINRIREEKDLEF